LRGQPIAPASLIPQQVAEEIEVNPESEKEFIAPVNGIKEELDRIAIALEKFSKVQEKLLKQMLKS
jgi:hypothetical protein